MHIWMWWQRKYEASVIGGLYIYIYEGATSFTPEKCVKYESMMENYFVEIEDILGNVSGPYQ